MSCISDTVSEISVGSVDFDNFIDRIGAKHELFFNADIVLQRGNILKDIRLYVVYPNYPE